MPTDTSLPPSAGASTEPRTLADVIRSWPDQQLADLLRARPDLATPAPQDSSQIAARAGTRASLLRAVDELDRLHLTVLDAVVVLSGTAGRTPTRTEVLEAVHASDERVFGALDLLAARALLWENSAGIHVLTGVADALRGDASGSVSGLQPLMPHAPSVAEASARIALLSPRARDLLTHVVDAGGEATSANARPPATPEAARTPAEELLAHHLLLPVHDAERHSAQQHVLLAPGQVGLALRQGRTTASARDDLCAAATAERSPALIDRVAAGAAFDVVRRVELILERWGTQPPGVLRTGGLGVRELRSLALDLDLEPTQAALLLESAVAAGLVAQGVDAQGDSVWLPTHAYETWAASSPARRWWALARAWLATDRLPALALTKDAVGKTRNALAPDLNSALAAETRLHLLREMASLPPGASLAAGTGVASLVARLRWRLPRRPAARDEMVLDVIAEATHLGLMAMDAAPSHLSSLVGTVNASAPSAEQIEQALTLLDASMPAPVDHLLIQADLTAVVPGPPETDLARALHHLAEVESRGGAVVYRFTPTSVKAALEAGWSGPEIHAFLATRSRTPVPQPLTYLVDDAVRTFGTLRLSVATAVLRSDDELLLDELCSSEAAGSLELRRIAPTVVVSTLPVDLLLLRLRESGHSPVVEAADGTVRVARPEPLRARSPRTGAAAIEAARDAARVQAVIAGVRTGDRIIANAPSRASAATGPTAALTALREAIEARATVMIGYVDNHGTRSDRIIDPLRLEGGQLTAHDHRSEDRMLFSVHRITQVSPFSAS